MKKLLLFLCTIFALAVTARACDFTWGPCESPFLNPNIALHFEGVVCTTGAALNCGYEQFSVFDVYAAFDECYQQDCGVVWDEGYCANFCAPALDQKQQHPRNISNRVNYSPITFWKTLRTPIFVTSIKKQPVIQVKNRFWWKHASHKFLL